MDAIAGVLRLGRESEGPVDIAVHDGRIAEIRPAAAPPARRLLACPALVNAHDHCRALSPTSFGGADAPLELWLMRLAAMPAIDPYLGALAAFGRAARGGAASVMAHYTRFHTPEDPVAEARAVAKAAVEVGVRVTPEAIRFLRWAMLCTDAERGEALLQAAWTADDAGADATAVRRDAASAWGEPPSIESALRLIDILRRAGEFHSAEARAVALSDAPLDENSTRIVAFQRARIAARDTGRHLISSALRPPARMPHVAHGRTPARSFWSRVTGR